MLHLAQLVKDELSGSIAKSYVAQISRFHRIQGSTMLQEAAEHVKTELLSIGLTDVIIDHFPADGAHKYWTHTSPCGWTVKSAELWLVTPEEKLICSYEDLPHCLHAFSNGTAPEGVTAELVDVGLGIKAEDYQGKNVTGKFVLATGRAKLVHEQAVYKRGALGVLTDTITYEMPRVRESLDIPDAHAYQAIWPTAEEMEKVKVGFSLSKRQGNQLRTLLRNGKTVKLKAKVDAKLFAGKEDVVTATLPGKSKTREEIFLVAHLCHPKPSANDNASGSGLLLEIARTIKKLIDSGKMQQPERTIRFLWVPETFGSVAYISSHDGIEKRLIAGINLDMVGQDQELCRSTLNLDCTPDSLPSFLNDYVFSLIEQSVKEFDSKTHFGSASTFRFNRTAFSGGSDHAEFTEATTAVPCVMLLQWPDLFYHTSMDTIDKVSEQTLKRTGWITTVAVLTLANANAETAFRLAYETAAKSAERLIEARRKAVADLFEISENRDVKEIPLELAKKAQYYRNKFEHITWRETEAVKSVEKLGTNRELTEFVEKCYDDINELYRREMVELDTALDFIAKTHNIDVQSKMKETDVDVEARNLVPRKLFKGTLGGDVLKNAIGEKEYEWYDKINERDDEFSKKTAEILNFIDGKRTAQDITKAVSAEYSPTEIEHVLKFLRDLEKAKLIWF